jgi:hypothetical protein
MYQFAGGETAFLALAYRLYKTSTRTILAIYPRAK